MLGKKKIERICMCLYDIVFHHVLSDFFTKIYNVSMTGHNMKLATMHVYEGHSFLH